MAVVLIAVALLSTAGPGGADGNEAPGAPAAWRSLSTGAHSCVIRSDARLVCWGLNAQGQLGLGDTANRGDNPGEMGDNRPTVDLGSGRTAVEVSAGNNHTCVILDNGAVKCWGYNLYGQLGLGDTAYRGDNPGEMGDNLPTVPLGTGRTATAISASIAHTCAILDDGTVKCWGYNAFGGLGQGHSDDVGDQPGEMGDALPAVPLGTGRTATAISTAGDFTCALLDDATVKCWGYNSEGELGQGDTSHRGDGSGELGDSLAAVDLGTGRTAVVISASRYHACALLDNGRVKCWGFNVQGELGQGDTFNRGDNAGEMGDNLAPVDLGTGRTASAIAGGELHTCAILDDTTVKCWGYNDFGGLGQGDANWRGDNPGEMGDDLAPVNLGTGRTAIAITGGYQYTCARLDNGAVKCWGFNAFGQLGLGDAESRGDEPGEMGDSLLTVDLPLAPSGVTGTVTEQGSGDPVGGAWLAVLNTSDFSIAGAAVADGSGAFSALVPPGSYYVYVLDPSGVHPAGFHGSPTLVTVTWENMTDVDPVLSTTRGSVAGTITETGSGDPIGGSWALSLSGAIGSTGALESLRTANGSGAYSLPGLRVGNHYLAAVDPSGGHATRFFPNSPNVPDASVVAVTAGNATPASVALPVQAVAGTGAVVSGTVTEEGTGVPLSGARVVALRAADFAMVRGATTNGSGNYALDVPAGGYKLAIFDAAGLHTMEWFDDLASTELASAVTVTAPGVASAALAATTGRMVGTITDDPSGDPVEGAWVVAIGPSGIAGGAVTAADGTYTIVGLAPGTYRATFADPVGGRVQEYFDGAADYSGGTPFNVTAAGTATVDADLAVPVP
jgi:alpha-tubulin suppressor-like RCC1 family protein